MFWNQLPSEAKLTESKRNWVMSCHVYLVYMYTTRVSRVQIIFSYRNLDYRRNLSPFPAFGTRLWNCLHPDWRKRTKRAFKRKIHKLLLTVLEIEDYCVDAHSLILNFKKHKN